MFPWASDGSLRTIEDVAAVAAPVHRLSFEDVLAMVEAGILDETTRVELEGGLLIEMTPSGEPHDERIEALNERFVKERPDSLRVRIQSTFRTPDGGFYLPDVMVIHPGDDLPRAAELVIEVAVTSRSRDMHKAATYAAAGVTEYWIVDVPAVEVLVHADPSEDGYATVRVARPGETLTPPFGSPALTVDELLGR